MTTIMARAGGDASSYYRCLLPVRALDQRGLAAERIVEEIPPDMDSSVADILVLRTAREPADLRLARSGVSQGIVLVADEDNAMDDAFRREQIADVARQLPSYLPLGDRL